jgi:translocator protein
MNDSLLTSENPAQQSGRVSRLTAAAVSSAVYLVPLLLSWSTSPAPQHPKVLLWYGLLRKPGYKPPDWVIPVSWGLIETGMAAASYRLLRYPASAPRNRALTLLALNTVSIGAWSRLFFGRRNLAASTVAAAAMVGTGVAFVEQARKVDKPAAVAGVPFVAWVAFATILTAALWRRNR